MRAPAESLPDEGIVTLVLEGDRDAFGILIRRYQQRVYRFGRRFFRNDADAEDYVQEVFIRAYQNLSSFRGDARFASWLMKVAWNHGINSIKRVKSYQSLAEETVEDPSLTPEQARLAEEAREALREAVRGLPENYAVCIDLYFFFGMKYEDISTVTGFPVNTIKSNVFRGKKLLRSRLSGIIGEDGP